MKNYKTVCIIGNNASGKALFDGGRIKIRLFHQLLTENGINSYFIELENWNKHLVKIITSIKKAINAKETILIMAGPAGSRLIIPIVNFFNKKIKTRVIYCPLGVGTLEYLFKKLNRDQVYDFLNNNNYFNIKDKKIQKNLHALDLIISQNEILCECYKSFYNLDNVVVLNNFRSTHITEKKYINADSMSLVFVARVCKEKGIFDLLDAVSRINKVNQNITLSIYGEMQLSPEEEQEFNKKLSKNIRYFGVAINDEMIKIIKGYDLYVLPTKYYGEGTSGSLIEAFLSGTPALISSYSQSRLLIDDCVNGFIYKIGDVDDLYKKILYIYNNRTLLKDVGLCAQKRSAKYTFEFNKETFFNYILGENK